LVFSFVGAEPAYASILRQTTDTLMRKVAL
jgi:hypothetical protein